MAILNAPDAISVTTSATLLINPTHPFKGILLRNNDAAATVYIGTATVDSTDGFPLLAGEVLEMSDCTSQIYGRTASGTVSVTIMTLG